MPQIATTLTHVNLAAARTLLDGSVRVHSILIQNTTASPVDVEFSDLDDAAKFKITVPADNSYDWTVTWMADNGLKVGALTSTVTVTVAHGAVGA